MSVWWAVIMLWWGLMGLLGGAAIATPWPE
jgi:hypothetical protein